MIWENGRKHKKYRKEWVFLKHQIEGLVWREILWMRPYNLETVWETLSHLAALLPRGAVVWEVRSRNGKVSYLLGAAARYIKNIEEAIKAHGDIQFHEVGALAFKDYGNPPLIADAILSVLKEICWMNLRMLLCRMITARCYPPCEAGRFPV